MKRTIFFLQFLFILNISAFSAKSDPGIWKNLKNAIELGTKQYINNEKGGFHECTVFVIKIISCSKNRGEFSISYILNDAEFDDVKASNYFLSGNNMVLIRTDSLNTLFTKKSGFHILNEKAKEQTFSILAGPGRITTSEYESLMILSYDKKNITQKYFVDSNFAEDKYHFWNDKR